jgi:predicted Zn-dependent protease
MRFSKVVAMSTIALNTCLLALASAPAAAQADQDLKNAMDQLSAGQAEAAYSALKSREANRAGQPDYDLALGLTALESGRHGEAIIAFQRILAQQPDNARAQAELARAYAVASIRHALNSQRFAVILPFLIRCVTGSMVWSGHWTNRSPAGHRRLPAIST